jgi:hypothetical protein
MPAHWPCKGVDASADAYLKFRGVRLAANGENHLSISM